MGRGGLAEGRDMLDQLATGEFLAAMEHQEGSWSRERRGGGFRPGLGRGILEA